MSDAMPGKRRVYIFTVTAGAGHVKAAEALKNAFNAEYPAPDTRVINVLDYTNPWFKKTYPESYLALVDQIPELWGMIYERTDNRKASGVLSRVRHVFNTANAAPLIRLLRENPPDVAVCTHFLPAEILSSLKKKNAVRFPWVCVVTDFEAHVIWMFEKVDLYAVPTKLAKYQVERSGTPSGNVVVTGIPIDPEFSVKKDRYALMKNMGLDPERPVILVMSGGFGKGPLETIVSRLQNMKVQVQLMVVAGKNRALEKKLRAAKHPKKTQIFGFVSNVDELLTVSDLLVSKPGGLTSSEALAKGVPMVLVGAIPGQESRNSDFLLENGAAISIANLNDIGFRVQTLLAEKGKLETMKANARVLAKPDAAKDIVKEVVRRFLR